MVVNLFYTCFSASAQ